MKYLGLLEFFDDEKGCGIIKAVKKDILIYQKDFVLRPEKLLKVTAIVFEIKKDNQRLSAFKAKPPTSYEDFKLILSYLDNDPDIFMKNTIRGKSRWGNPYQRTEMKSYNLISFSLDQLLKNKQNIEVSEYFKTYFDENNIIKDQNLTFKYFEKIKGLELTGKHELIREIFKYFLSKADNELLYKIWRKKIYLINAMYGEEVSEEFYDFPVEIFYKNISDINEYDLFRIQKQSNGIQIIRNIIAKKISDLDIISKKQVEEIVKSINDISKAEIKDEFRELFIDKLLILLNKLNFEDLSKESVEHFKIFLDIVKNKQLNFNYTTVIHKFNETISEEARFRLWQSTRYFEPQKLFYDNHFAQLKYADFLMAPKEFHQEYFNKNLVRIGDLESIQNFCKLLFLLNEIPYKALNEVFSSLSLKYKVALWISFIYKNKSGGQFSKTDNEESDIPLEIDEVISYFESVTTLNDLFRVSELIKKLQDLSKDKTHVYFEKEGFLKIDEKQQNELIKELLLKENEFTNSKLVDIFKTVLNKCKQEESLRLCKSLIPRLINDSNISINNLTEIVNCLNTETKNKQAIFSLIADVSSSLDRVVLWSNNYTHKINFNDVVEVFDKFQYDQQPNLLRKLFSLVHNGQITEQDMFISQLSSLALNTRINLDVRICLRVIDSLANQQGFFEEKTLSEIVCQYVNENISELIQVSDLFQLCPGRTWMAEDGPHNEWFLIIEGKEFPIVEDHVKLGDKYYSLEKVNKTVDVDGESYSFKWSKKETSLFEKLYETPKGITFCDAIKSEWDNILKRNFYWCCNGKCYKPHQTDQIHLEWNQYSLRDFIKILKLPFNEDEYYRFVSVVNRANRLMEKLKCKSCNRILRDSRTSEFAFYRVTTFHCTNPDCQKHHEVVYLNHCLNWKCLNIVDSRVSSTCSNGWYICNYCSSCCSQAKLEKRLENLYTNGAFNQANPRHQKLKYQVENKLGHMERGEKFDYQTGIKVE